MALGEALAAAGEPRDSVERLREAVRLAPDAVPARLALAMVLEASSRRAEAQHEYEQILVQHPAQPIAANNLAWIYLDEGRLDEALGDAVVAKAGLGNAPEVNDTLGWVYFKRHQPKLAIPLLAASLQARPASALYRSHLDAARRALQSR
jgi:Tfp pilus assembly protein PilF